MSAFGCCRDRVVGRGLSGIHFRSALWMEFELFASRPARKLGFRCKFWGVGCEPTGTDLPGGFWPTARAPAGLPLVQKWWIVERTFSWMYQYRRLIHDYEASVASSHARMVRADPDDARGVNLR